MVRYVLPGKLLSKGVPMFNPIIIVPCYNHSDEFQNFAPRLATAGFPVMVIDDGSDTPQSRKLQDICSANNFEYIPSNPNRGKGWAMKIGFDAAQKLGYTHALQIDADGQHDVSDIGCFIDLARKNQTCLVVGNPIYDADAPRARRIGRKITDFWVAVETWNLHMPDAMCGMRVYPLHKTCDEMRTLKFYRMGFDIEILVKMYWAGVDIIQKSTHVIYPKNGRSNFKMLRDNLYIGLMHTYLCVIMPVRMCQRIFQSWKKKLK